MSFGSVDEIILSRIHEENCHDGLRMQFHTRDLLGKVKFLISNYKVIYIVILD